MAASKAWVKVESEDRYSADGETCGGIVWEIVGESHLMPLSSEESPQNLKLAAVKTEVFPAADEACVKSEPSPSEEFSNSEACTCGLPYQVSDGASSHQHSDCLSLKPERIKEEPKDLEWNYGPSAASDENPSTSDSGVSAGGHRTDSDDKICSCTGTMTEESVREIEADVEGVGLSGNDSHEESSWFKICDVRSGEEVQAMMIQDTQSGGQTSSRSRKRPAPALHESHAKRRKEKLTVREIKDQPVRRSGRKKSSNSKGKGHSAKTVWKTIAEICKAHAERDKLMRAVASVSASMIVPGSSPVTKVSSPAEASDSEGGTISPKSKSMGFVYPHCSCKYDISAESAPGREARLKHVAILHFMNKRLFAFIQRGQPYMSLLELNKLGLLPCQSYVSHALSKLNVDELNEASDMELVLLRRVYTDVAMEASSTTMITPFGLRMVYKEALRRNQTLTKTYTHHLNSMFYLQRYKHKCPWTLLITPTSDEGTLPVLENFQIACPPAKVPHKPLILAGRKSSCQSQPNLRNMKSSASQALIAVIEQFGNFNVEPYCKCETTTANLTVTQHRPLGSTGVFHHVGQLLFLGSRWIYCWIRPYGIFVSVQELKVLRLLPWKKRLVEDMLLGGEDMKDRTFLTSIEATCLKPFASSIAGELNLCLVNVKFLWVIYRCLAKFEKRWIPHARSKFFIKLWEHDCPAGFVNPNISKCLPGQQCEQWDCPEMLHVAMGHDHGSVVRRVHTSVADTVTQSCNIMQTDAAASETESGFRYTEATARDTGSQTIAETSILEAPDANPGVKVCAEGTVEDKVFIQSTQSAETEISSEKSGCGKGVDIQRVAESCQPGCKTGRQPTQRDLSNARNAGNKDGSRHCEFSEGGGLALRAPPDSQIQTVSNGSAASLRVKPQHLQAQETLQKGTPETGVSSIANKPGSSAMGTKLSKVVYMGRATMKDGKIHNDRTAGTALVSSDVMLEPLPKPQHRVKKKIPDKSSGGGVFVGGGIEANLALEKPVDPGEKRSFTSFRTEDYPRACTCQPPPCLFSRFSFCQCMTMHKNENMFVNKCVGLAVLLPGVLNMVVYTFWEYNMYYFSVAELLNKEYFPISMDFSEIPQMGPSSWFLEADHLHLKFLKQQHINLKMSRFCRKLISAELLCHLTAMKGRKVKSLTQAGICLLQIGHSCPDTYSIIYATGKPPEAVTEAWRRNAADPVVQSKTKHADIIQNMLKRTGSPSTGQCDKSSTTNQEGEADSDSRASCVQAASSSTLLLQNGKEFGIAVRVLEPPTLSSNCKLLQPVKLTHSDFFMYSPQGNTSSSEIKSDLSHLISSIGKSFTLSRLSLHCSEGIFGMRSGEYLQKLQDELLFEGKCVTKTAAARDSGCTSGFDEIMTAEPEEVDSDYIKSSLGAQASNYWVVLTGSIQYHYQNLKFAALKLEEDVYISWNAMAPIVGNADLIFQLGCALHAHIFFPPMALKLHLNKKKNPAFSVHCDTPWISMRQLRAMYWLAFYNGETSFFPKTFSKLKKFVVDEVPTGTFQDFVLIGKRDGSRVHTVQWTQETT